MKLSQAATVKSLVTVFSLAFATHLHAAVTNVAWYRLGENDPGAASGVAVTNTTTDLLGLNHARQINSPRYTNAVSPSAANGLGSSLAVHFSGTNQCFTNAVVSTATNNFGIEAWVKPNTTNAGSYFIAQNGFNYFGSWVIAQSGNAYIGALTDTVAVYGVGDGSALASPGVWAHVALVRNNGTNRFYFNGVANGPPTTNAPSQPVGNFTIGCNFATNFVGPGTVQSNSFFNGTIDEVRVFTFAPSQFSTNDLLFNVQRVATLAATSVTSTNAVLNGSAHPVGFPTTAWFEWGTTTNYGDVTPAQSFGSGAGATNFSQVLTGLTVGVTYHFRAVASNNIGVVSGTNQSFTVPLFTDIGAGLPGVSQNSVAWGDYDNDGRLDILLAGGTNVSSVISQIWRNTGGGFTNINAGLPGQYTGTAAWGDYDNDGRLDFILTGLSSTGAIAQVWRNTGSGFTNINTDLPGAYFSSAAWGDYDSDGRLDILLVGQASGTRIAQIWRNTGTGFEDIHAGLTGVDEGTSVAWADYDNDGRLDFLLTGATSTGFVSQVWRNTGQGFTNINAGLTNVRYGSVAWGDYDYDGRLDILLAGTTGSTNICQVWRNTTTGFVNINAGLPGVVFASVAWGDYDNDGKLDILLAGAGSGALESGQITQVWRNTGSGFTNINAGLPGVRDCSVAWGDYDNDGRLDILLAGYINSTNRICQVWRNDTPLTNTAPTSPTGLGVALAGNSVIFTWSASSDAQTPASGLIYNLRVGTTPGGTDIVGPMAGSSGLRRLPRFDNLHRLLSRSMSGLPFGETLYWSIQAVDSSFAGSAFAGEQSFTFNTVFTPPTGILVAGDANADSVVDEAELNTVLSNYFPNSPFLQMTNVAGLGGTNVTFALTNSLAGAFGVEYTTNLMDWFFLGPATPRYLFTDTNAPAAPQRSYRLRWPYP